MAEKEVKSEDGSNKTRDVADSSKDGSNSNGTGMRRTISPYDITSNDNPGSLLTQFQLKGENYDERARALRTELRARKKFGFVDGSIKCPEEGSPDLEDWWTNNSLLVSWIMNTIEPASRSTMSHMEVDKDLWEDIKDRFSVLKKLWEELSNYEQMPTCKCGLCTCNLGAALEKKREEERVHQFLMGLDETVYGTVRSNLLAQDPLPNLNRIYSTLVQEERVKIMSRGKDERGEVMSFTVQAGFKSRSKYEGKDKNVVCGHCNCTGHESDSCFQLIGYPDWWGDRTRGSGRGSGRGKAGQQGMTFVGRGHRSETNGLNDEQWQALLNILNNAKIGATKRLTGKCSSLHWILDTGASHHMTGRIDYLSHVRDVIECPVRLPNGEQTAATKEGTVVLSDKLRLANVLYVPSLQCNLISVSQLINESNCIVQFTDKFCAIQDRILRMVIGAGELREGLYYLHRRATAATIQTVKWKSFNLWHKQLGHPSSKVLELVPNVGTNKNSSLCNQVWAQAKVHILMGDASRASPLITVGLI
ncbi:Gag-polypeptide of LTR copia-type [Sesbania bispinosa]|nr:Gag-polypeptide of LTR copia-type [Sesbania bispinosa]